MEVEETTSRQTTPNILAVEDSTLTTESIKEEEIGSTDMPERIIIVPVIEKEMKEVKPSSDIQIIVATPVVDGQQVYLNNRTPQVTTEQISPSTTESPFVTQVPVEITEQTTEMDMTTEQMRSRGLVRMSYEVRTETNPVTHHPTETSVAPTTETSPSPPFPTTTPRAQKRRLPVTTTTERVTTRSATRSSGRRPPFPSRNRTPIRDRVRAPVRRPTSQTSVNPSAVEERRPTRTQERTRLRPMQEDENISTEPIPNKAAVTRGERPTEQSIVTNARTPHKLRPTKVHQTADLISDHDEPTKIRISVTENSLPLVKSGDKKEQFVLQVAPEEDPWVPADSGWNFGAHEDSERDIRRGRNGEVSSRVEINLTLIFEYDSYEYQVSMK